MGTEVHLWRVGDGEQLIVVDRARLNFESRLQEWLGKDISILDPALLVIGREVETDFGGRIDILCIDAEGDLVVVELKRDRTPRDVMAQALDYAAWVTGLSHERVTAIANDYLRQDLESAFRAKFEVELPETLNGNHRMLVVGSEVDASSERIMRYLSDHHGVSINAATFHYFRLPDGSELLARLFLIEPSEVELKTRTNGPKRLPNLSYEQLHALAVQAGVSELYEYAVGALGAVLQKQTRRSSIAFVGSFDQSKKVVISLLPGDSEAGHGLRYQIYKNRLAELTNLPSDSVEGLMPAQHEDWSYAGGTGPEWQGFEGFIRTREEIDRVADPLRRAAGSGRDASEPLASAP